MKSSIIYRVIAAMLVLSFLASCSPQVVIQTVEVPKEVVKTVEVTKEVVSTVQVVNTQVVVATEAPKPGPKLNPDVKGDIELWHFWASPVRRNGVRRIIAMCQQELPNIKVTDTVKPFGDIWTANIAAVAGGSGMPDVIVSDRPTLPKDAADGVYTDLQQWATRDGVTRDQYYGWAWDQTLYNGDTYGIPFETDVRVLFWNKQLFKQAGLDPEKPPVTWDDLKAYADKLDVKNPDGTYKTIGFFPLWNAGFNPFWAYLDGAPLILPDGTPALNSPEAVDAMTWIKTWVDRYGGWQKLQDFKNSFGAPPNDIFMGSGVAMFTDIFGYESQLEFYRPKVTLNDKSTPRMEWGVAMLPYKKAPADWSGGFSLSIPKGAKNPEAAWEFIKCMAGADGQISWGRDTQAQPTNLEAASNPVLLALPGWNIVGDSLKVSTGGVFVPKYPNWSEQIDLVQEKVWTGELTPQAALDQAQKGVEDKLK